MKNLFYLFEKILKSILFIIIFSIILSCGSNEKNNFDTAKKNLLEIKKDWNNRTQSEKAIGCWTADANEMTGNEVPGAVHSSFNHQLIFYSDGSMDDISYVTNAISKESPLTYNYQNYTIENGVLTYTFEGNTETQSISVFEDHIEFMGLIYKKTNCY